MDGHRYRSILLASVVAALGFYLLRVPDPMPAQLVVLKGTGVGLLAVLAWIYGPGRGGTMLAGVMALGAMGDVLIEYNLIAGAAAFLIGHLLSVALYLGHRRNRLTTSQLMLALVILVTVPFAGWGLPIDRAMAPVTLLYAVPLALMAATAWASRFPRYRVGLGAVLFVLSDLLIFARGGPLVRETLPHLLVWPLYYLGQLMICTGVLRLLRQEASLR